MRINNRPSKQTDRGLFLALQADAKDYPGGIRALAEMLGVNGNTLGNGLNPDHDAQPPSFALTSRFIKTAQAKRTVSRFPRSSAKYRWISNWRTSHQPRPSACS